LLFREKKKKEKKPGETALQKDGEAAASLPTPQGLLELLCYKKLI
jgi:hypothetical protein